MLNNLKDKGLVLYHKLIIMIIVWFTFNMLKDLIHPESGIGDINLV